MNETQPLLPVSRTKTFSLSFAGLVLFLILTIEWIGEMIYYLHYQNRMTLLNFHFIVILLVATGLKWSCSIMILWNRTNKCYGVLYGLGIFIYCSFIGILVVLAYLVDKELNPLLTSSNIVIFLLMTCIEFVLLRQCYSRHPRSTNFHASFHTIQQLLKPYFWPQGITHRLRALSTYLLLVTSKACNLFSPIYMATATNALTMGDSKSAIIAIVIYCGLVFTAKLFKELQSVAYLKVKQTAYIEIAKSTFEHVQSLSLEWHLKKKLGDVLRSMDRGVESANQVVSYLFLYLAPTIIESVIVLFIFAMHFQLASLALVGFLGLIFYSIATINITLWRKKFREKTREHDNAFHDRATDCLINFETVKYFTNENYEAEEYCKSVREYQYHSTSTQASLSVLNSTQSLIIQMTILLALITAIPHAVHADHGMNIGNFVAISVYLSNLFTPLSFLGTIYNMVINAYVDMKKLMELLNLEPDVVDCPNAPSLRISKGTSSSIEFQNVSFSYPSQNGLAGIRDISFTIPANTTTALVGTTGAGKTTISRLLFRFYDIDTGKVLINGQNIAKVTQKSLRRAIGIVPQDTVLFNNTVLHNIKYGNLNASMTEIEQTAKDAQIYDMIMALPLQWQTLVGERGLKLSGGEKQRIAIARTLLKNPPIVVLDEATSALDSVTEQAIQKALTNLRAGRTMLIIAHRLSTIRHSTQILVLENGRIVEQGSHEELMQSSNGKYRDLWLMQQQQPDT